MRYRFFRIYLAKFLLFTVKQLKIFHLNRVGLNSSVEVISHHRIWILFGWWSFGSIENCCFSIDPWATNNFWNAVLGMAIMWIGNYCTTQTEVQRYCNVDSKKKAKLSIYVNLIGVVSIISVACLSGIAIFVYYAGCNSIKAGIIIKNQVITQSMEQLIHAIYENLSFVLQLCLFLQGILRVRTQGTEAEIDRTCGFIKEAQSCAQNFTQRCLTRSQLELVDFFAEGGRSLANEFCTPGTEIREEYKKHGQCLSEARSQSKQCLKDLQKSLEEVTQTSWNERIPMACCGHNRFRECLSASILNRCGEDALALSRRITRIFSSRLPEIMCQSFEASKCEEILPSSGTEPRGDQSDSVLSRILSTYIGN
uniref:DUF19 domain-containing protein n=1 Tax=Tetranychus urticae TaxID=32264 RepID=T1KU78_TETUR